MKTVNRIIVVALLVVSTMLCCVLLAGAKWVIPALADQLNLLAKSIESAPWYQIVIPGVILAFVVDFILVSLIIIEMRQPKVKFIHVEKAAGGEVEVSVASIVDRLRHEVDALPGVLKVSPRVSGRRGGVAIHLDVDIAAGLDVPVQAGQIVETVRQAVEEKMGLKMAKTPRVKLRTVPYPQRAILSNRVEEKKQPPAKPADVFAEPKKIPPLGLEELPSDPEEEW
jgi:hypothetical protein